MKVNFAFNLEIKVWSLEEERRGTESMLLEVQCEVSTVSDDLGCRDVGWCLSIVFDQVQSQCSHLSGDFGALYASICWQALCRCWFTFHAGFQHLPTLPKALPSGLLTMILLCLIGQTTCLTWTLYGIRGYFQENDEKQLIHQYRRDEGSIVPQQCHRLIASMPHRTDAGVCAEGAPTKYWVHKLTYFKQLKLFCLANPFSD